MKSILAVSLMIASLFAASLAPSTASADGDLPFPFGTVQPLKNPETWGAPDLAIAVQCQEALTDNGQHVLILRARSKEGFTLAQTVVLFRPKVTFHFSLGGEDYVFRRLQTPTGPQATLASAADRPFSLEREDQPTL